MSSFLSLVAGIGRSIESPLPCGLDTAIVKSSGMGPSQNSVRMLSSDALRCKKKGLAGLGSFDGVSSLRGIFDTVG